MSWTSHGHWYGEGDPPAQGGPDLVARCGGPAICPKCAVEAGAAPSGRHPAAVAALQDRVAEVLISGSAPLDAFALHLGALQEAGRQVQEELINTRRRAVELEKLLAEVLGQFTQRGHPGEPCLRTSWIREDRVAAWWKAGLHWSRP